MTAGLPAQFQALERRMCGQDGSEDAVECIGRLEEALGLADLVTLTAPPPPASAER